MSRTSINLTESGPKSSLTALLERPVVQVALFLGITLVLGQRSGPSVLFLLTTVIIMSILAMGTNLLFGWSGIASFGQAAYFGIGAYTVALLKDASVSPLVTIVLGSFFGAVGAAVFFSIARRTTGVQFAMLTLAAGQMLYLTTYRISALGGENGIPGISRGQMFGFSLVPQWNFFVFVAVVSTVAYWMLLVLYRSPFGYSSRAVKDDATRAAALGIPVVRVRFYAFTLAGAVCGLAGSLFALQLTIVSNLSLYWLTSGNGIVMALLGGLGSFWGPVIGAFMFIVSDWYLRSLFTAPMLFVGLAFLIVVLVLPEGLVSMPGRLAKSRIWRIRAR